MEILAAGCRCARCRSCVRRSQARPRRVATTQSAQKPGSQHRAFVWSRSDTRVFPYRPKRRRREVKRRLVSSALESAAKDGRRCVQKKCAAVERAPAPECWSNCAARGTKLATACCKPAETRIVVKNESPVLERRRSYPTGTSPHFRASAR